MNIYEHIQYWLESADRDLDVARSLYNDQKYEWCLFVGHLVLEKALKAAYVQNNDNNLPPKIHNLLKIAGQTDLQIAEEDKLFLDEVNDFNLEVRYPDYKNTFHKLCTQEFAENYLNKIIEFYQWIKFQLKSKK